jgi:hypothetical protein
MGNEYLEQVIGWRMKQGREELLSHCVPVAQSDTAAIEKPKTKFDNAKPPRQPVTANPPDRAVVPPL